MKANITGNIGSLTERILPDGRTILNVRVKETGERGAWYTGTAVGAKAAALVVLLKIGDFVRIGLNGLEVKHYEGTDATTGEKIAKTDLQGFVGYVRGLSRKLADGQRVKNPYNINLFATRDEEMLPEDVLAPEAEVEIAL